MRATIHATTTSEPLFDQAIDAVPADPGTLELLAGPPRPFILCCGQGDAFIDFWWPPVGLADDMKVGLFLVARREPRSVYSACIS